MEFDIFKRKLEARNFILVKKDGGLACYKNVSIGKNDYTIESSELTSKKPSLYVYKFGVEKNEEGYIPDILVAQIKCRNILELDKAIKAVDNLIDNIVESPFDRLLKEEDLILSYHWGKWLVEK